jgi:menaquinone-dependent protoporphyrinogen IX oxidase
MEVQVLVAYATKRGATAEIAERIGGVLRQAGLATDVLKEPILASVAQSE